MIIIVSYFSLEMLKFILGGRNLGQLLANADSGMATMLRSLPSEASQRADLCWTRDTSSISESSTGRGSHPLVSTGGLLRFLARISDDRTLHSQSWFGDAGTRKVDQ
jgi:hypothetical protein